MKHKRQVLLGRPRQLPATPTTLSEADNCFVFEPDKWVEEPQQVRRRQVDGNVIFELFERRGVVADFQPRPLWGFEDGRPFTVLDAKMSAASNFMGPPAQVYKASSILWDVHIDGQDSLADAVRHSFSLARGGWANSEPITLPEGRLSPWSHDNRPGLEWEPSTSHTVHNLTQRFPTVLTALFHLWTGSPASVCATQVHILDKGWCDLERFHENPSIVSRSFLPSHELDLEAVAGWLPKAGSSARSLSSPPKTEACSRSMRKCLQQRWKACIDG